MSTFYAPKERRSTFVLAFVLACSACFCAGVVIGPVLTTPQAEASAQALPARTLVTTSEGLSIVDCPAHAVPHVIEGWAGNEYECLDGPDVAKRIQEAQAQWPEAFTGH